MNTATRTKLAKKIIPILQFGDGSLCVMRAVQLLGVGNLPRSAREMSFAAQDYMAETTEADRDAHAVIEHMLTAPRRAEWPA